MKSENLFSHSQYEAIGVNNIKYDIIKYDMYTQVLSVPEWGVLYSNIAL